MGSSSFSFVKMTITLEKLNLPTEMEPTEKVLRRQKKLINIGVATAIVTLLAVWSAVILLYVVQCNHQLQVTQLENEVNQLKAQVHFLIDERVEKFLVRGKRQTRGNAPEASEKSGVPVFDYAYEANLVKGRIARNHLSVYPTLMGEDGEELNQDKSLFTHQNQNSFQDFQDHNQLGILRDDAQLKYQSAYSRRLNRNAHRHSRVAQTPETTSSTTAKPFVPKPIPQSMLRTLDSSSSSTYDSEANPMLSVHLQARLSADESSTDLETGVHNSWRLSAWSKKLHGASLFTLNEDEGQIEIPEDGLYFVYAQVEYMDVNPTNGFEVDVDDEAVISCVTTSTSQEEEAKQHNTCHTSAVLWLKRGSLLNVRDKDTGRYSLLHSKGTFFGLTKMSSC